MKDKILKIINTPWFPGILIILALIIFIILAFFRQSTAETTVNTDTGTLIVSVTGLRNNNGNVIVCLYAAGPFTDLGNIAEVREMSITSNRMIAVFANVYFREYAVFVLHDENKNRITDIGSDNMPIEGMGTSNTKIVPPDKPDFKKAKFNFNQESLELQVQVEYW